MERSIWFVLDLRHLKRFSFFSQGGAIIFIDELDAIGTKRFGGEQSGDREVQRTMLELLNQLDGFSSNDKIKVQGKDVITCWQSVMGPKMQCTE